MSSLKSAKSIRYQPVRSFSSGANFTKIFSCSDHHAAIPKCNPGSARLPNFHYDVHTTTDSERHFPGSRIPDAPLGRDIFVGGSFRLALLPRDEIPTISRAGYEG